MTSRWLRPIQRTYSTQVLTTREEMNRQFKTYLETLPALKYPSHYKVHYIKDPIFANRKIRQLVKTESMFGVDMEWPPNFKKNEPLKKISLIQICSSKTILLIQLSQMKNNIPDQLIRFLESKRILKSGVDIASDGRKLSADYGVVSNGLVELRELAKLTNSPKLALSHQRSLQALTGMFLGERMAKGKVRMSNWSQPTLTVNQIKYAALDAYASYQLFVHLKRLKDPLLPIPVQHLKVQ